MESELVVPEGPRRGQARPAGLAPACGALPPGAPTPPVRVARRARRLQPLDRRLLALLGLCRYLTAKQVVALGLAPRTEKGVARRLRCLAAEGQAHGDSLPSPLFRSVPYRTYAGDPMHLWGLAPAGSRVATAELGRELKAFGTDVGAVFAEHFVFLTDFFVRLAQPSLSVGVHPRELPFRWNVAEDVELPWRERDEAGCEKPRVIRPDAVLEVPGARRRFFIECEMGTHTLTPVSPDKPQATVRKLERYDAYVSGFADVRCRLSHYRRKYPDGWPCEVLFLVRSESRRRATEEALARFLETLAGTRLTARAFTLEQAAAHCAFYLPPKGPSQLPRGAPAEAPAAPFYGEAEHAAVKDFVLQMTAALAEANTRLRGSGLLPVPGPVSKAAMLDFLRRAQAEMLRRRASLAVCADG
ncbi:MAG: replication-relaxation family protein [Myxococcaceae bacterium]